MGEANYRLVARFPSKDKTDKAMDKIYNLFMENSDAYAYWQDNRGKSKKEFWPKFKSEFPATTEYLITIGKVDGDCNNGLSGILDFGQYQDEEELDHYLNANDDTIEFYGESVWHFSDWEPLAKYIRTLGASKIVWNSDEYENDWPKLEDHAQIVQDILEKKEILPTLLGINKDLDELIEISLKK